MSAFFKKIFFSTILLVLIGLFPFLSFGPHYLKEILCAFSISLINATIGYYLVIYSINKPDSEFYTYVYGGMMVRATLVFGFSIYMIKSDFVQLTPYMLFLMLFYTIHQWTEISSWLKELPSKKIQLN